MKIHIEDNDKPLTKEQVKELTKSINYKLIFSPSKPIKITNDEGIWRRINMSKELEALKNIKQDYCKDRMCPQSVDACKMCGIGIIESALKALEIIKREPNEVIEIITTYDTWEEYIKDYPMRDKTIWHIIKNKTEFDLLKEELL